jgi:hypothetical protein
MGEAGLNKLDRQLTIYSVFYFYGDAASQELSLRVAQEIANVWNEPRANVRINRQWYDVLFVIEGIYQPDIQPGDVWYNTNPRNNYFRIEEFSQSDISFVDGIRCNTGYFKYNNLLNNSTTAAHEYGHTLGLVHPKSLDIRGRGRPGIMYPRGTICDPAFQYDPSALPLQPGGTMNPFYRKVLQSDIDDLHLQRASFSKDGFCTIGDFSSVYHSKHPTQS